LASAQADSIFKSALNNASLVVADGIGVTIMAKIVGVKVGPRITGTDYFFSLMKALQARGAAIGGAIGSGGGGNGTGLLAGLLLGAAGGALVAFGLRRRRGE
jgi:UDP-N-acetyl-D-mannosaminuronic acid transferase (WecB/TagA/CpsF family)